jgi:very-short-patch-repair endonuclease
MCRNSIAFSVTEQVLIFPQEFFAAKAYPALYNVGIRAIPQYNVEQYDLDFAVIIGDRRLNIEVDGERYHRSWTGELCPRDRLRNQRLIELGWEVKRFWVYEVRDRLPECVQFVKSWIERGPN